jgi:opacity protein-like surface antigen
MMKYIKIAVVMLVTAGSAIAGTDFKSNKNVIEDTCRFRDTELQLDLFGTGGFYQEGNPGWGGGAAVNVFFLKYIGLGVEQSLAARNDATEWGTFGNLFLRYPICGWNLSPYVMAGLGAVYGSNNDAVLAGTVGGGLEYRFTDNIGIFADARWLYNAEASDSGAVLARTGLKFAF